MLMAGLLLHRSVVRMPGVHRGGVAGEAAAEPIKGAKGV